MFLSVSKNLIRMKAETHSHFSSAQSDMFFNRRLSETILKKIYMLPFDKSWLLRVILWVNAILYWQTFSLQKSAFIELIQTLTFVEVLENENEMKFEYGPSNIHKFVSESFVPYPTLPKKPVLKCHRIWQSISIIQKLKFYFCEVFLDLIIICYGRDNIKKHLHNSLFVFNKMIFYF